MGYLSRHSKKLGLPLAALTAAAITPSFGQEIAPDDPAIADSLGVWLTDAANTFDTETGIWSDSSGNGFDATPVGEVNVGGPVTYIGPTAATVSGGAFSVDDVSSVHFANDADDLIVASDLNGDAGLAELTIFVVYNAETFGNNASITRPAGIGSLAALQANPGDHFNLGSDPSIRKDNGQIGMGSYSQTVPLATTFIRTARMSATSIDEWFNTDGTPQSVISTPGLSFTTSSDEFYLGDLRAGASPIPGFGPNLSLADFDIIQALVYTSALTDEQITGVNEWLGNNLNAGGGASAGLAFTEITVSEDKTSATLTWRSKPNKTYAVDLSTDLAGVWEELDDEVESQGEETTVTMPTFSGNQPDPLHERVFYRVRELP